MDTRSLRFGVSREKGPGVFGGGITSDRGVGSLSMGSVFVIVIAREDRHNVSKYREPEANEHDTRP